MTLTRRYRFSASHRLHSPALSDEANRELYGKCNNPFGHGHDYALEVAVAGSVDAATGRLVPLQTLDRLVAERILSAVDHKYLNTQLPELRSLPATTENLAAVILDRLRAAWPGAFPAGPSLHSVRVEETKRNRVEIESESQK